MQDKMQWKTQRIYAIGGLPMTTTISGILKREAEDILALLLRTAETNSDKERLDYLDSLNQKLTDKYGIKYGWKLDMNHNRVALTDSNNPPLSVRDAIDDFRKGLR
jgi:hypothetical protein